MRTVPAPPDRDPVAAYLARLGPLQPPKLLPLLDTLALLLSDGRADAAILDWAKLEQSTRSARPRECVNQREPAC